MDTNTLVDKLESTMWLLKQLQAIDVADKEEIENAQYHAVVQIEQALNTFAEHTESDEVKQLVRSLIEEWRRIDNLGAE